MNKDIRTSIKKLRCNALQDFLKLIIQPDWNQPLYEKIECNMKVPRLVNKLVPIYNEMQAVGVENFSINNMDVSFISTIITESKFNKIVPTKSKTKDAIKRLTEDRNIDDHSNENEEPEELYLRYLLALCDLRNFVLTVGSFEVQISEDERAAYCRKYIDKIEELKNLLWDECIKTVYRKREIREDIEKIKKSDNQFEQWCKTLSKYNNNYLQLNHDHDSYNEFYIKASDAGIKYAHSYVAGYFLHEKNYQEFERRLKMTYQDSEHGVPSEMKQIVDCISEYLEYGNEITDEMKKIIDTLKQDGYPVEKTENGNYYWKSKHKISTELYNEDADE